MARGGEIDVGRAGSSRTIPARPLPASIPLPVRRALAWLALLGLLVALPRLTSHALFSVGEAARLRAAHAGGAATIAPRAYALAAAADPAHFRPPLGLGRWLRERGATAQAIPLLEEAVALDPGAPAARLFLGLAYVESDRMAEALPHFRAIGLPPRYLLHQGWLAVTRERARPATDQQWATAERYYGAAATLDPTDPTLRAALADFYILWPRDFERAMATLRQTAATFPAEAQPHLRMAQLHWDQQRDGAAALAAAAIAARLAPHDPAPPLLAAEVLRQRGDLAGARHWARRAVAAAPTDATARALLRALDAAP